MPSKIKEFGGLVKMDSEELKRMIEEGRRRKHHSTNLHERIVGMIAQKLKANHYSVEEDPQSVDLLASKGKVEAIIEVKTVTRRSISHRLRLGIGQLSEYRYRRQLQKKQRPLGVLAISSDSKFEPWLLKYLETDVRLGLTALSSSTKFHAHTNGPIERVLAS